MAGTAQAGKIHRIFVAKKTVLCKGTRLTQSTTNRLAWATTSPATRRRGSRLSGRMYAWMASKWGWAGAGLAPPASKKTQTPLLANMSTHLEHHILTHLGHHKQHVCGRVVTGRHSLRSPTQCPYASIEHRMGTRFDTCAMPGLTIEITQPQLQRNRK